MKILVLPRDDTNPYQDLLYKEMRRMGVRISYPGHLTPSQTLNLMLLPLELAVRRLGGARVVHLHWVFAFSITGAERFPILRRVAQSWFTVWLWSVQALGIRLVWTAHNLLPHSRVFADDVHARRRLVAACCLVIAHSQSTLTDLAALGIVPRKSVVIPHGPFVPSLDPGTLRKPGAGSGPRRLLFFGRVEEYKGVDDLLAAFAELPPDLDVQLTVAGECSDPELRSALTELARLSADRVVLRLEHIPDDGVTPLLADTDAVVLPFREVTTSGSAVLALCHGRPLIVPVRARLADLPDEAVIRYNGTVSALSTALADIITADGTVLAKMSAAAIAYSATLSWSEIAATTVDKMRLSLADRPQTDGRMR